MSLFTKAKIARENKKGFTLVELIVVLVILAILAAMMIPALLGWIDKAKQSKYMEEAHSIYMAIQAYEDEQYAKTAGFVTDFPDSTTDAGTVYVNQLIDPTVLKTATVAPKGSTGKQTHTVGSITNLSFVSQDGKTVSMTMGTDGTWTFVSVN